MAKRRKAAPRRKAKTPKRNQRIEAAAQRAAESFSPHGRVRKTIQDLKVLKHTRQQPTPRPGVSAFLDLVRPPRQRALRSERRVTTTVALGGSNKPLGERRRRAAQGRIPEELRRIICERRAKRREALFAKGGAGGGKRVRKPSQRRAYALFPVNC